MKSKKENINTQNRFLIACVCSILLLLTLCYFGVNSNFKGTSAVATNGVSCPASAPVEVTDENTGINYCCPDNSYKVGDLNGSKYCYKTSDNGYIALVDGAVTCFDYKEKTYDYLGNATISGDAVCKDMFDDTWKVNILQVPDNEDGNEDCTKTNILSNVTYGCTCTAPLRSCGVVAEKAQKFCYVNENGLRKWMTYGEANSTFGTWTITNSYSTEETCTNSNYTCYYCSQPDIHVWSMGVPDSSLNCQEVASKVYNQEQCSALDYTVSFNSGTGSIVSSNDILVKTENKKCLPSTNGKCIVDFPEVVSTNGKSFVGWSNDSCKTKRMINSVNVTKDENYEACWSDEPFMLSNSANADLEMSTETTKDKIYLGISLDFYESDYGINPECSSSNEDIATCRFNDDVISEDTDTIELVINKDMKGTAFIKIYNYDDNGSGEYNINDGYVSIRVTDPDGSSGGGTTTPQTYTVTYNGNGGTIVGSSSMTVESGKTVTLPNASWYGYTFNGWYTAAIGGTKVGNVGATYTVTSNITLYAQWTKNAATQYTVTYNGNGGSVNPSSATAESGKTVTLPTPTRDGYTFDGWFTAATGGTKVGSAGATYTVTKDITLYAQWTPESSPNKTYTVKFFNNGTAIGNASCTTTQTYCYIDEGDVPVVSKTGYVFGGWSYNKTGACVASDKVITYTENYAEYHACLTAYTYTVKYDGNGTNVTNVPASQNKTYDVTLTLTTTKPTRSGYTFAGWNTKADGSGTTYLAGSSMTNTAVTGLANGSTITLYAKWTENAVTQYTVTYDGNGGSDSVSSVPSAQIKKHGESLTLSTTKPTRSGYTFLGWSTSSSATIPTYSAGGTFTNNANTTLYAVWFKDSSGDITTKTATIPTSSLCRSNLVYNGSSQQLTNATSGTGYILTGYSQTNAGTYTITAILESGYMWSDNTKLAKTFSCSIGKAIPILTLDKFSTSMADNAFDTILYTYYGDGALTCNSKNTSIATCEINGGRLIITPKAVGTTTVELKSAETNNYMGALQEVAVIVTASTSGGDTTPKAFTAIFDANGGTLNGSGSKSCTLTAGTSCEITSLPTASKTGYIFKGWGVSSSCSSGSTSKLTLSAVTTTYKACWVKDTSGDKTPNVDKDGNTTGNPTTGDITIAIVWFVGIFAIAYAFWYFKKSKEN